MFQPVRDDQQRQPVLPDKAQKKLHHLLPGLGVKAGVGFVGKDEGRALHQHAGDGDALLLAARQAVDAGRGAVGQTHSGKAGHGLGADLGSGKRLKPGPWAGHPRLHAVNDIGQGRQARHKVVALPDDPHLRAEAAQVARAQGDHILP